MYPDWSCAGRARRSGFLYTYGIALLFASSVFSATGVETPGDVFGWGDSSAGQASIPIGLGKVIAISAGRSHNLAIRPDESVVAWGGNITVPSGAPRAKSIAAGGFHSLILGTNGQVFGWSVEPSLLPPGNLGIVTAIAAGDQHCLALRPNLTVVGWGFNDRLQISIPSGLGNVIAIAAGEGHSLALRVDGSVVGWGDNTFGQAPRTPPIPGNMKAIAAGGNHSLALRIDGKVFAWGDNSFGQLLVPGDLGAVVAISAGGNFSVALLADHSVRVWGDNTFGQANPPAGLTTAYRIAAGSTHCLAIQVAPPSIVTQPVDQSERLGGSVSFSVTAAGNPPLAYQWRFNGKNMTNAGATTSSLTISNLRAQDAGAYSVVVTNGAGTATSRNALLIVEDPPVIDVQPVGRIVPQGSTVTFEVGASGTLLSYRWRKDGTAILGASSEVFTLSAVKLSDSGGYDVVVTNLFGSVTSVVANLEVKPIPAFIRQPVGFTAFPGTAGSLSVEATNTESYQWLFNGTPLAGAVQSSLVLNPVTAANAGTYAVRIANPWGTNTSVNAQVSVSATAAFSEVVGWGEQTAWNGVAFISIEPPPGLNSIRQVAAGRLHSLALTTSGVVMGWGDNLHGEILPPGGLNQVTAIAAGDGFSVALRQDRSVVAWGRSDEQQTAVTPGATNVVALAAGVSHTLALRADGSVTAWGSQRAGESSIPSGLGKVTGIAAGDAFNLVLLENGTVTGWGRNDAGQRRPPASLSNVVAVAAGRAHGLALRSDGSVVGWGDNTHGQTAVPTLPSRAIAIAAGTDHSLALLADNQVVVWGNNNAGQTEVPAGLNSVRAISGGGDRCLVIRTAGTRFLPPQFAAGKLRLSITSSDGGSIEPQRAGNIRVYASENLLLPLEQWTLLPPPTLSDSGQLQLLYEVPNREGHQFFQAVESP